MPTLSTGHAPSYMPLSSYLDALQAAAGAHGKQLLVVLPQGEHLVAGLAAHVLAAALPQCRQELVRRACRRPGRCHLSVTCSLPLQTVKSSRAPSTTYHRNKCVCLAVSVNQMILHWSLRCLF
jgi:hypothetical protein